MANQDPSKHLPIGTRVRFSPFGEAQYGDMYPEMKIGGVVEHHQNQLNYNGIRYGKAGLLHWFNKEHLILVDESWKRQFTNLVTHEEVQDRGKRKA